MANQGFVPDAFTSEDRLARAQAVDLRGGAVVSGSFQGLDRSYLFHALKVLGPTFVGVTQVPQTVSDQELQELDSAGVRAVRINVKRGGSEDIRYLENFARRVHELVGWHTHWSLLQSANVRIRTDLYPDMEDICPLRDLWPRVSMRVCE